MARFGWALALAALLCLPASGCLAGQSASFTVTVTIPSYPLLAAVQPGCQFVVAADDSTVDCVATVRVFQPTLEPDGWLLALSVTGLVDTATGSSLPPAAVSRLPGGTLTLNRGQAIDPVGGPHFSGIDPNNAALDHPQTVLVAEAGFGNGFYIVTIDLRLAVPAHTVPGTYVPTWAVGVTNASV